VDGVIVLLTTDEATTACHQAFRLNPGTYLHEAQKLHAAGELKAALPKIARPLGSFSFVEGTDTPVGDLSGLRQTWNSLGVEDAGAAAVFSPAPVGGTLQQAHVRQAQRLVKEVGGESVGAFGPAGTPISDGCDVVTLIAEHAPTPCQSVWRVDDGADATGLPTSQGVIADLQAGRVNEALQRTGVKKLADLTFFYRSPDLDGDPAAFAQLWTAGDAIGQVATVAMGQPAGDETHALQAQRSQTIAAALKDAATAKFTTFTSDAGAGCSAITLLIHRVPVQQTCLRLVRLVDAGNVSSITVEQRFRNLALGGKLDDALAMKEVSELEPALFSNGATLDETPDHLQTRWKKADGGALQHAFVVRPGTGTAADAGRFREQATVVATTLNPNAQIFDELVVPQTTLVRCPAIAVLVVPPPNS
jgi:hypothetical protein